MTRVETPPTRRPSLLPLLCAVAAAFGGAACKSNEPEELSKEQLLDSYRANARDYLQAGHYAQAKHQADRALEIAADDEQMMLIEARANMFLGQAGFIAEGLEILQRRPNLDDFGWQMTLGGLLERKGMFLDEDAREVREGRGRDGTGTGDPEERAQKLAAQAQESWRQARHHFERSNELRTGELEVLKGLVRTSALLGELETSLSWSRQMLDALDDRRSLLLTQLDQPGIAAERERQLMELIRDDRETQVKTRLHRATALQKLGRLDDAIEELEEVIALAPEMSQPYSMRGQLQMASGQFQRARASFQDFLDRTKLAFEDPEVQRTIRLQDECDQKIRAGS